MIGKFKLRVLNRVCLEDSLVNRMPNSNGLIESNPVTVLRDTACSGVTVKKNLIKKEQLTGNIGYAMTVERTLLKAAFENIKVSALFQQNNGSFLSKNSLL